MRNEIVILHAKYAIQERNVDEIIHIYYIYVYIQHHRQHHGKVYSRQYTKHFCKPFQMGHTMGILLYLCCINHINSDRKFCIWVKLFTTVYRHTYTLNCGTIKKALDLAFFEIILYSYNCTAEMNFTETEVCTLR